jgi:succinoglycan biosynthesis transport protein ExoP
MSHVRNLFQKPVGSGYDLSATAGSVLESDSIRGANTNEFEEAPVEEVDVQPTSRIVFYTEPHGPAADRFRFLRMRLRERSSVAKLKSLLIASPLAHDGKSTVTLNLATALSEGGTRKVLVIDADLHRSSLLKQLGLGDCSGLADCLETGLNPLLAIRKLRPLGWYLLPTGEPRSNPTELLQGPALSGVVNKLLPHFDWILFDTPPLIPLTDALSLRQRADASLLVVRAGQTPQDAIEESVVLLGKQHLIGIVLNGVEGLDRRYAKYGYYGTRTIGSERSE